MLQFDLFIHILKHASTLNASLKNFRSLITPYHTISKYVTTSASKCPYSSDQENVSAFPVMTLSISSRKTNVRAASCRTLTF